ncbi:MAG TPA: ribosome small subunit-dependent GTPase A [Clostridia bacterium]|nr:ribosome small subunit-dependent GTPase A [Clostridia bacterium]
MKGQVVKAVAGRYTVKSGQEEFICGVRKKIKNDINILVGDFVEIEDSMIEKVYERKNQLVRPYVANIDTLLIVVAKKPEPDWILIEKLLLNCYKQNIKPIICINKTDLLNEEERNIWLEPFKKEIDTACVSAINGNGVEKLKEMIKGQLVCFAGQSAVGKTSILNVILGESFEVGELSKKIDRGKNTTRHVEIYQNDDIKIIDTCGFSILETLDVSYDELMYYYESFVRLQDNCRYQNCTHVNEPDCAVRKSVEKGEISKERYQRYLVLFKELKENWRKKYE